MRQIINHEHLRVYGIVTRHIKLVTVGRLLLLVDDVLTDRRFCQLEYLQVIFSLTSIVKTMYHIRLVSHEGISAITPRVRNF